MLNKKYNENDVRQLFSGLGTIEECTVLRDQTGQSKGCAFVTFGTKQSAMSAIKVSSIFFILHLLYFWVWLIWFNLILLTVITGYCITQRKISNELCSKGYLIGVDLFYAVLVINLSFQLDLNLHEIVNDLELYSLLHNGL